MIHVLELPEVGKVAASLGITDRRFISRMKADLIQYASIAEAPRSGRPPKYTAYLLGRAQDYMLHGVDAAWTKEDVVQGMINAGILDDDASVEGFWERFTQYMRDEGTPLVYGSQRLTFALSQAHIQSRLWWCQNHKSTLTDEKVGNWWFVDEIVIEEGPHPKGKHAFGDSLASDMCCALATVTSRLDCECLATNHSQCWCATS